MKTGKVIKVGDIEVSVDPRYSVICDKMAKYYVDRYAGILVIYAAARKLGDNIDTSMLEDEQLGQYIDFEKCREFWESADEEVTGKIMVAGIFSMCDDITGKLPVEDDDYYLERWHTNINRGLVSMGLREADEEQ